MKRFKLSVLLLVLALVLAACGGSGGENGQDSVPNQPTENQGQEGQEQAESETAWPTSNVEIIVPYPAGGVSDINARAFADVAKEFTDYTFTIKNIGGGSGTVGNYELVKAKPDGKTIMWGASGHMSSTLHITDAPYTPDDFTIVNKVGHMSTVLVVPPDSPFETLEDFVNYAKENPGKINMANPGEGTVVALLARLLEKNTEIELTHVPFEGSGPALNAVMGGHVDAALLNASEVKGQIEAGTLRGLAALSEERIEALPDIPTVGEQGYPDVSGGASHFIVVPNGMSEDLIKAIDEFTKKVYNHERFIEVVGGSGFTISYKDGAEARAELDEWYKVSEELYRLIGEIE